MTTEQISAEGGGASTPPQEGLEPARRVWLEGVLGVLTYVLISLWGAYQVHARHYGDLSALPLLLIGVAIFVSVRARARYQEKLDVVLGVRLVKSLSEELSPRWVDKVGDRGVAVMNAAMIGVNFPVLLAQVQHLQLFEGWRLFEVGAELPADLHFFDWLYFMGAQFLPINTLMEVAGISKELVTRDQQLNDSLTLYGEGAVFLMNFVISLVALDIFSRRATLKGHLDQLVSAVDLSASALTSIERAHLAVFAGQAAAGVDVQGLLNDRDERAHDLIAKVRALTTFLTFFSKKYLYQQLSEATLEASSALSHAGRAACVRAALQVERATHGRHRFTALALSALDASQPVPVRAQALAEWSRWGRGRTSQALEQAARDSALIGAAHSGSVLSALDYERLTLAALSVLAGQGGAGASVLSGFVALLRSPSLLLRREAAERFQELKRGRSHDEQGVLDRALAWAEALSTRAQGEGSDALRASIAELATELELKRAGLSAEVVGFVMELLLSSLATDLERASDISAAMRCLALFPPQRVSAGLWGVLARTDLSEVASREIAEGLQSSPALREALLVCLRHVLREGAPAERLRAARLMGDVVYDREAHRALLTELREWLSAGDHGEGSAEVLFELICALARLCDTARVDAALAAESRALLTPFEGAPRLALLPPPALARLELARRYALAQLALDGGLEALFDEACGGGAPEALALFKAEHPRLASLLDELVWVTACAARGEGFSLPHEGRERLKAYVNSRARHPVTLAKDGDELGKVWVERLADEVKEAPSAVGLLALISVLKAPISAPLRRHTLRKLSQLNKTFSIPHLLGALRSRSYNERVSSALIGLIDGGREADAAVNELTLALGDYPCASSISHLWGLIESPHSPNPRRERAIKALTRHKRLAYLPRFLAAYEQARTVTVRAAVVRALTRLGRPEADEALEVLLARHLSGERTLNHTGLVEIIRRFTVVGRLSALEALFLDLPGQHLHAQLALLNACVGEVEGGDDDGEGAEGAEGAEGVAGVAGVAGGAEGAEGAEGDSVARSALTDLSPMALACARELSLKLLSGSQDEKQVRAAARALPRLMEGQALSDDTLAALERGLLGLQNLRALGQAAEALVLVSPDRGGAWLKARLAGGEEGVSRRTQLINALARVDEAAFFELAEAHIERWSGRVGDQKERLTPNCINSIIYNYMRVGGRAALRHVRRFAEELNPAYSMTAIRVLSTLGDRHADVPWLNDLHAEARHRRLNRAQGSRAGATGTLEVDLLATCYRLGDEAALPKLLELALMQAQSATDSALQRAAKKELRGVNFKELLGEE